MIFLHTNMPDSLAVLGNRSMGRIFSIVKCVAYSFVFCRINILGFRSAAILAW